MIWYVALGGAVGSAARFLLGVLIQQRSGLTFPLGTLVINITGSFLLGFLLRYGLATPALTPEVRALLTTGFCGGYTTFSTFSYETATLLEEGDYRRAMLYVVLSLVVSLAGTFLGFALAREVLAARRTL
jgi:CrcB protein